MKTTIKDNPHSGHRERLRNTANEIGFENLPEHQQLELLLSFVIPRKDTNIIAHNLIKEFGSFSAVLDASAQNLMKVSGLGEVAANFITTCGKIPFAYKTSKLKQKTVLKCPSQIIDYFEDFAASASTERFCLICLNAKSEVIKNEVFGENGMDKVSVDFRELIQKILMHNAKGVIICHTHPDGPAKPSSADIEFTKELYMALAIIGIKFCDHIIFANNENYSFFNNGLIDNFMQSFNQSRQRIGQPIIASPEISFFKD